MRNKKYNIVEKVSAILIFSLMIAFVGGCLIFFKMEKTNTEYMYKITDELLEKSVEETEQRISEIQGVLYDLITNEKMQEAGSNLIRRKPETTAIEQVNNLDAISECIQQGIQNRREIVCANYLDPNGAVRVVASTHYYRVDEQLTEMIRTAAIEAAGKEVALDGSKWADGEPILILAREMREKKQLTLHHMGVVVLFVDMEVIGKNLVMDQERIFLLQKEDSDIQYILSNNDGAPTGKETESLQSRNAHQIYKWNGEKYYVVNYRNKETFFSYALWIPYRELFGDVEKAFRIYVILFTICAVCILNVALWLTKNVTKDIGLFIQHIKGVTGDNPEIVSLYIKDDIRDRDVYLLKNAYNKMAVRINDLVRDNYQNKLLSKEAQIQALQSQMNPHFLYNTLNSLYWMTKTAKMTAASDMISSLGILLREAISAKDYVIPIEKELDMVCHYCIIQKHRYEDRLEVIFDIAEDCYELMIPKFSIQPLVENAIAYGLECMLDVCKITIKIYREHENCICQVRNNGPDLKENIMERLLSGELKAKGNGVGLLNIHHRVQALFGQNSGVKIFRDRQQTVAQITLSCMTMGKYRSEEQHGREI